MCKRTEGGFAKKMKRKWRAISVKGILCILCLSDLALRVVDGFQQPSRTTRVWGHGPRHDVAPRHGGRRGSPAVKVKPSSDSPHADDLEGDEDGARIMSMLMGEVNQRDNVRRAEGLRLLERPSALIPPHAVLEHVLGSLMRPDFPTDGRGLRQAFLFSALDEEVNRGPVDYRRDWTDPQETRPRFLDRNSFDAVTSNVLNFLLGMSEFSITGPPLFSEDDHHVTFPVRVMPDGRTSSVRWVALDFRLGRVRNGSHKDCWLIERVVERAREGPPDAQTSLI